MIHTVLQDERVILEHTQGLPHLATNSIFLVLASEGIYLITHYDFWHASTPVQYM